MTTPPLRTVPYSWKLVDGTSDRTENEPVATSKNELKNGPGEAHSQRLGNPRTVRRVYSIRISSAMLVCESRTSRRNR